MTRAKHDYNHKNSGGGGAMPMMISTAIQGPIFLSAVCPPSSDLCSSGFFSERVISDSPGGVVVGDLEMGWETFCSGGSSVGSSSIGVVCASSFFLILFFVDLIHSLEYQWKGTLLLLIWCWWCWYALWLLFGHSWKMGRDQSWALALPSRPKFFFLRNAKNGNKIATICVFRLKVVKISF